MTESHKVIERLRRRVNNMEMHYTYRVTWSADDGEYVATCVEFPSLSWLDSGPLDALSGLQKLVREVVADMQANGETPPEPLADRTYSGRFVVRVPPEMHRELALQAAEEGVSLNRLASARLAYPTFGKHRGAPAGAISGESGTGGAPDWRRR